MIDKLLKVRLYRDYTGKSPLHLAAANGYVDTVNLLISVHHNLLDQKDKTGVMWTNSFIDESLRFSIFISVKNTPLHYASMHNHPATVFSLLNAGCAYVDNDEGKTPIELAIKARNVDVGLAMVKSDRFAATCHEWWLMAWYYYQNFCLCCRCSEIMTLCSDEYLCPTLGLIEFMPEVYKVS